MSDDRELLELAAKAGGAYWTDFSDRTPDRWYIKHADGVGREWNPLIDDGDALRLAVKLRLNIEFTAGLGAGHRDEYMQVAPRSLGHLAEFGPLGTDAGATIRRAIVRAAAAIGAQAVPAQQGRAPLAGASGQDGQDQSQDQSAPNP